MVHVYKITNQDSQRRKSLKCKPVDIPVFFWRSVDNIIMVLTKTKYSNTETEALLELLTVLLEYIDLFLSKAFSHV